MDFKIAAEDLLSGPALAAPLAGPLNISSSAPRRGQCGKLTSLLKINYALKLLKLRRALLSRGIKLKSLSYQAISNKVGVFSRNTISKWDHLDMSAQGIFQRRLRKKRKPIFTSEEENILLGWVIYKDLTFQSSTTTVFKEFVQTHFKRKINSSFITKFMKRNNLSLKLVGNANQAEINEETFEEGLKFLETLELLIERYNFRNDQIISIDKTYLMTSPYHKNVRHICPRGSNKSRKITCARGSAHEVWTTLRADGVKSPLFIQTKEKKLANMKIFGPDDYAHVCLLESDPSLKKQRPGETGMLNYLRYMINEAGFIKRGDLLLFDGEQSFATSKVQKYLLDSGVYPFTITPSVLHQLLNPCDNNFHSAFKLSYYRLISNQNYSAISVPEKFRLALQCYENIGGVHDMFKRCGLIESNISKREVLINLMHEGMRCLNKNDEFHRRNLLCYLDLVTRVNPERQSYLPFLQASWG